MERKGEITISPLHKDVLKELLSGNPDNPTTVDYNCVKITNKKGLSLSGFLAGQSVAIPLHPPQNAEQFVQKAVENNWETFLSLKKEHMPQAFFRFLDTPVNTTKKGKFTTMLSEVKGTFLVHIYPDTHFEAQEDFVKVFTETYNAKGLAVLIEDPPC